MLTEKQLLNYADVLLWGLKTARSGKYKKGDIVLIRYNLPALRLAEILNEKLLKIGINPVLRIGATPVMERNFFDIADSKQLIFTAPGEEELYKNINGSIFLHAPESITHLRGVDPKKIGKATVARKHLKDILDKREEEGIFGWTLCMLPTEELAKHARLSVKEYTNEIAAACFLNKKSPVEEWQKVYNDAARIKKWLNGMSVKTFHIESENTDLEITPGDQRKWIGISGHNIPSFELFLSPDWRNTKGVYFANQPSYRSGNYVENVRLEFKKGEAVKIEAQTGEEFVKNQLAMDKGANKIGEFSLTDKRFSKINKFMANTLFDENFGGSYGNCHIALGSSYSDTFSGNPKNLTKEIKRDLGFNDSALHWDLVNTEKKRVTANLSSGKTVTIYENGKFSI
ncbi:MAG: aminopeptidase [Desulfobacterium sp.]|nr:aminopeptidase [Desulfobacterium sp.]MBU3949614.1 aminopeptidase [Pseudomonadota bacterium]MBU4036330.1 aminopeptidase [Pseudomonadota bacterium]